MVVVGNDDPTAEDDFGSARAGDPTQIDVLRNDDDPNGDALAIVPATTSGATGVFACTASQCAYTPPLVSPTGAYPWTATFNYGITDGHGGEASATVSIRVTQNQPPTANGDEVGLHGTAWTLPDPGQRQDPDGDALQCSASRG